MVSDIRLWLLSIPSLAGTVAGTVKVSSQKTRIYLQVSVDLAVLLCKRENRRIAAELVKEAPFSSPTAGGLTSARLCITGPEAASFLL